MAGFFDNFTSGNVGGLLGNVAQGLGDNTGLLYGLAANGFAGAQQGMASDRAAAAMRQKEQQQAQMQRALTKFAADKGIDPAYAGSEEVFKLWLDDEHKKQQLAMQDKNLQADIAYRNRSLGLTERHYNDENAYRDAQEKRQESAPISLDPYKDNYVRDPSAPNKWRRLDEGGGATPTPAVPNSTPDGGSFGGGSGVMTPAPNIGGMSREEMRQRNIDPREYAKAAAKIAAQQGAQQGGGTKLSEGDKKAIREADQGISAAGLVMKGLDEAERLSKTAYDGWTASARGKVMGNLGSESGNDTMLLDNVITQNVLSQLKVTFGGNPTEGEREILREVSGAAGMPKKVRDDIFTRAKEAVRDRVEFNKQTAAELRGGTYYKPRGSDAPRGQAGGASEAITPDDALAELRRRGRL